MPRPKKEIVSIMALESLAPFIAQEEAKKCCQLSEAFPTPIQIYDSATNNGEIWKQFWNNPPAVVGIDTEGNQTSPPVLVQISTLEYTRDATKGLPKNTAGAITTPKITMATGTSK